MAEFDATIQMGHVPRTRGATGTSGWGHTEQEFTRALGNRMASHFQAHGYRVSLVGADEAMSSSRVFVALHQDGSINSSARGASVGYPMASANQRLASIWKAHYARIGWPGGFRPDNYTRGLRNYYGYRRITADAKFLIEHGFATNRSDQEWMWANLDKIGRCNFDAIHQFLGGGSAPPAPPAESTGGQAMLITFGFYTYLNEGWRYRFLSDPNSVAAFKASGMPVANLSEHASTWKALRKEALQAGRLEGEPADVAGSY